MPLGDGERLEKLRLAAQRAALQGRAAVEFAHIGVLDGFPPLLNAASTVGAQLLQQHKHDASQDRRNCQDRDLQLSLRVAMLLEIERVCQVCDRWRDEHHRERGHERSRAKGVNDPRLGRVGLQQHASKRAESQRPAGQDTRKNGEEKVLHGERHRPRLIHNQKLLTDSMVAWHHLSAVAAALLTAMAGEQRLLTSASATAEPAEPTRSARRPATRSSCPRALRFRCYETMYVWQIPS
mmetsp:Transcript_32643/g.84614  ORF Transcript_32643/g.84614 Transcript_32643/m.84614 type:complete len:238 (-) Transcript_32643:79-792(-)